MAELPVNHIVENASARSATPKLGPLPGPAQPAVEQSALTLPGGEFVTTLTLNSGTCKWPIGDPTQVDFHYCGQPPESGSPYCDAHERKSYQPVRSRVDHRPSSYFRSR